MKMLICVLSLVFLINLSCKTNTDSISTIDDSNHNFNYTKADSIEAMELSLWFSAELFPPDSLVNDFLYKLNLLRNTHGDTIAALDTSNRFSLPWESNQLLVKFDDTTFQKIVNNIYIGWDTLPVQMQPDTILDTLEYFNFVQFGFNNYLHPRRLAEIYSELPGVIYAEQNGFDTGGWGEAFPWYPGLTNDKLVFLFYDGIWSNGYVYYYFKFINTQPLHIGTFDTAKDSLPEWWNDAHIIKTVFDTWDGF
jgi:hypothetical protein